MKLIAVNDKGEILVIAPEDLKLVQISEGKAALGLPVEEGKIMPFIQFDVNLAVAKTEEPAEDE